MGKKEQCQVPVGVSRASKTFSMQGSADKLCSHITTYCRYNERVRPQEYAAVMPTVALDLVVCKSTVVGKVFEAS